MNVVFDTSMLIMLFDDEASPPLDEQTGQPVSQSRDRLRYFINTYGKAKGARIIIPTPTLSEFLVKVQTGLVDEFVGQIQRIRGVHIAPFSLRAAIELAEMQRSLSKRTKSRIKVPSVDSRFKVKFDQQIVSIAKVESASLIYSDDKGLASYVKLFKIETVGIADLPLPPDSAQGVLQLDPPEAPAQADNGADGS